MIGIQQTQPTPPNQAIARSTLLMVLAAESAFFGTMIMSFLYLRIEAGQSALIALTPMDVVFATFNTGVLLTSAVTAWCMVQAARRQRNVQSWLVATLILGGIFVAGQILEFGHSGMRIDDSALGGAFFALMSFHALHVLAGGFALVLTYMLVRRGSAATRRDTIVQMTAWFWYYVVAVWAVLYLVLYWV